MWDLLDRYFTGPCTPDELEQVARWIADNPERARELALVRRIWDGSVPPGAAVGADPDRFNAPQAWEVVQGRIAAARQETHPKRALQFPSLRHPRHGAEHSAGARPSWRRHRWLVAAAAVVISTISVLWMRVDAWRPMVTASSMNVPMRDYTTARGQRTEILLGDGTRVMLSVRTRLRVPNDYGAKARDVYLDGEAFFDVAHNATMPFRVHTAGALAEDLGTAFVIRAYAEDTAATVVVAEGRVAFRAKGTVGSRGVALGSGQLGRLDASRLVSVVSNVDVEQYLAWQHAQLVFKNTPLRDVVRELGRWYDVDVTLGDSTLATVPITGSFTGESADAVLGDVARLLDLRYTRNGGRALLAPSERSR